MNMESIDIRYVGNIYSINLEIAYVFDISSNVPLFRFVFFIIILSVPCNVTAIERNSMKNKYQVIQTIRSRNKCYGHQMILLFTEAGIILLLLLYALMLVRVSRLLHCTAWFIYAIRLSLNQRLVTMWFFFVHTKNKRKKRRKKILREVALIHLFSCFDALTIRTKKKNE